MTLRSTRRGFALVVVLWVVVGGTTIALITADIARDAMGTARNRANESRAYWLAYGCVERARNAVYEMLWPDDATPEYVARTWNALDVHVGPLSDAIKFRKGCHCECDEAIPAENKDCFVALAMTLRLNLMALP